MEGTYDSQRLWTGQTTRKKWKAQIVIDGKNHHLGYFDAEYDAARAFNKAAQAREPEFAYLNVVDE